MTPAETYALGVAQARAEVEHDDEPAIGVAS